MFRFFSPAKLAFSVAASAVMFTTACGDLEGGRIVIGEDRFPAGNALGVRNAAIDGQFGPFSPADEATRTESYNDGYWTYVTIYAEGLAGGQGTAFAMVDFEDGSLDRLEPGTVYYSNSGVAEPAIIDEAGDSYVRVDDETELVQIDDPYVALCGEGMTEDGEDAFFDLPADEVLIEVEEIEDEDGLEDEGENDDALVLDDLDEALLEGGEDRPDLLVKITALAWDIDDATGEYTDTYQVANARFVVPR
jgi:hypothetical protein